MRRASPPIVVALVAAAIAASPVAASAPALGLGAVVPPAFSGAPATPRPVGTPLPPQHPFMAPNGVSGMHVDAYQTDANPGPGPLGRRTRVRSLVLPVQECATVTFDRRGRIVSVCVGLTGPVLYMLDPATLRPLAAYVLPLRNLDASALNLLQDTSGGAYFYLDHRDRAVIGTNDRRVLVIAPTGGAGNPGFALRASYDLTRAVPSGDKITAALPDWSGRIWFVTLGGRVGTIDRQTGAVRALATGEEIQNSFAVDDSGGVFVVTDRALYRFDAAASGAPAISWREVYGNTGVRKPGQIDAGSGTTPTIVGDEYVAIADNANPVDVVVYRRARVVGGSRVVCVQPVFRRGRSATENSLIAAGNALIVENNHGYLGPQSALLGATTAGGLQRVDVDAGGCHIAWTSREDSLTPVPKLSLANGLVYGYTKTSNPLDPWYLTAIDFRTGRTVFRRLTGLGPAFNNNYAPITLGPDGTAYVGITLGLVAVADTR